MTLYTTMPLEIVMNGFDTFDTDKKEAQTIEVQVNGLVMEVTPTSPYKGKIVRLISPNPMDFLNPAYAPGQEISFIPRL